MAITLRWWERQNYNSTTLHKLPLTTKQLLFLEPTLNEGATLLRSRIYPALSFVENNASGNSDFGFSEWTVEMVAWYDPGPGTVIPQPDDLDSRIVATARLYPQRYAKVVNGTNSFGVTWAPLAGVVESFGQRKPPGGVFSAPGLYVGMWVLDPGSYYYTTHSDTDFVFTCYAEALWGI